MPHGRLLEYREKNRDVSDSCIHTIHPIGRKTSRWVYMVRWAIDKEANNIQAWLFVARDAEKCQKQRNEKENWSGPRKTKIDNVGRLRLHRSNGCGVQRNYLAMPCKIKGRKYKETCRTPDARKTKYACIADPDDSTRKRWRRESTHWTTTISSTNVFPCSRQWK